MNRVEKINSIRKELVNNRPSIGSWMQLPNASLAEIMGDAGYDWVAVDMEHGSVSSQELPNLFRALELGGTLPLARLAQGLPKDCKQALDAGAGGVIVPMIQTAAQLSLVRDACCWPPTGSRGVGYSRANLFGRHFEEYSKEAQSPLLIAMIENSSAVDCLEDILKVDGLDAVLIGPYDLSASLGVTARFDEPIFTEYMNRIKQQCDLAKIPCGLHIVKPSLEQLQDAIKAGYLFLAYSIDAVFFNEVCRNPFTKE